MQLTFNINDFEGPLDLLLHLIKSKKMDIYNIDISLITKEYIDFINNNDGLSIDAYSEYLVMASELIHLKSKLLLNQKDDEDDAYEYTDPDQLTARLLEYQKIKNIAGDFKELEEKRNEIYTKLPSNVEQYKDKKTMINSDITLNDLLNVFESFLNRQRTSGPTETKITRKELSVEERIVTIKNKLQNFAGKVEFLSLFDDISKPYVIVTFLAILNMAKNKEIKITQKNNFSNIYIESSEAE
ncbi:MAG: segregation/condensation protein A [Bacilli bacterium]|nr:segregation/condensation protein A [Bacilli bacterium]